MGVTDQVVYFLYLRNSWMVCCVYQGAESGLFWAVRGVVGSNGDKKWVPVFFDLSRYESL